VFVSGDNIVRVVTTGPVLAIGARCRWHRPFAQLGMMPGLVVPGLVTSMVRRVVVVWRW